VPEVARRHLPLDAHGLDDVRDFVVTRHQ
jgi:hypothetical protein